MPSNENTSLEKVREILKENDNILIAGHVNPDGDCIGACLGLGLALKKMGKQVFVYLEQYNIKFDVIPGKELICDSLSDMKPGLFVALDCADLSRLGEARPVFEDAPVTVCIDHHETNEGLAVYNYIVPTASSTSELIYNVMKGAMVSKIFPTGKAAASDESAPDFLTVPIDQDIAAALYAGIIFDTGGFRHGCTGPETHRIAGELIKTGIDFTTIYNELLFRYSYPETQIFGKALSHLKIMKTDPIAYSYVSCEDLAAADATSQDLDGIVEYFLNIRGIEVSFFLSERTDSDGKPSSVKASFRSKEKNVGKIAAAFGGGGHRNAAGCTIQGVSDGNTSSKDNIDSAIDKIISILKREFVNK